MVSYGLPKRQESDPVLLSADTDPAKLRLKCALISRRSAGRQVSETGHGHEWLSPGLVTTVASVPINFFFSRNSEAKAMSNNSPTENENL